MAMAAVEVEWACRGSVCGRAVNLSDLASGMLVAGVLVVPKMLGLLASFVCCGVHAVRRHRRPAELERQHGKHQDGKAAAHGGGSLAGMEWGYRMGLSNGAMQEGAN